MATGLSAVPVIVRELSPAGVQFAAPLAWTTLALTLHVDGTQHFELTGASPFPRHWVYDKDRRLAVKSATIDYQQWSTAAFGRHTPWGDTDSPAFVSEVESALERELSQQRHCRRSPSPTAARTPRPESQPDTPGDDRR